MDQKTKSDQQKFDQAIKVISDDALYTQPETVIADRKQDNIWYKDPHYFKKCKISLLAAIKMLNHANMGVRNEVMGLMLGKIIDDTFVIMDTFALPVEATETRVNAGSDANVYSAQMTQLFEDCGRKEMVRGWYHSHPEYGCWLSGIDVATQTLMQKDDPMLAIVIDPIRTMTSGKVEIGAFRAYPENYSPPDEVSLEKQIIPVDKIEDFGVHYKRYYSLECSFFKSTMDSQIIELLWNKYWVNTVTKSSLFSNNDYFVKGIKDMAEKSQRIRKGKKDKMTTIDDLMGKSQSQYSDFVQYALEKNQAVIGETLKNQIFNYQI